MKLALVVTNSYKYNCATDTLTVHIVSVFYGFYVCGFKRALKGAMCKNLS